MPVSPRAQLSRLPPVTDVVDTRRRQTSRLGKLLAGGRPPLGRQVRAAKSANVHVTA